jgi:DNA-binding NarL/FixJ family response regulator
MAADPLTEADGDSRVGSGTGTSSGTEITVLIADDHPLFRKGLRATIQELPGVRVVDAVADGAAAVARALELVPDVVLMDLAMPVLDGCSATAEIVAAGLGSAVLVLTMADDIDTVSAAVAAGAHGYLLKDADEATISHALSTVAAGGVVFGPLIGDQVLASLTGRSRLVVPLPQLTNRDREVLDLVAQGLGNVAIARRLSLSDKTIRNQVSAIVAKLGVRDRGEAIARARAAGLGRAAPVNDTRTW